MGKFIGNASEARQIMNTVGKESFKNLIFKRIKESAEDGFNSFQHYYGGSTESIDEGVVNEVINDLISKGYEVTKVEEETDRLLNIKW